MENQYSNVSKISTGIKLSKLLDDLKDDLAKPFLKSEALKDLIDKLDRIRRGDEEPPVKPLALYIDIMETLRKQAALKSTFPALVSNAEEIYATLFLYGENTPEFDKTVEIFKMLTCDNGLIMKGFYDAFLFASFRDKSDYLTLVQLISMQNNAIKIFECIKTHALDARAFFIDDTAYMSYLLTLVNRMTSLSPDMYENFLKDELWKIARSNGIYDIDPVRLAQVEKNVHSAEITIENGKNILTALEHRGREIEQLADEADKKAKESARSAELYLDTKVKNATAGLDSILTEYTARQKESIHLEKEAFLKELFAEAQSELDKYTALANSLTGTTAAKINSLSHDADDVIRRLNAAAHTNEEINARTEQMREDRELLDKIARLSILNEGMIDHLCTEAASGSEKAPADVAKDSAPVKSSRVIKEANPLLDRRVPFRERFALAMKEKERRIKEGELFHEMFDDVLTAVMEEVNPYLIGPSGCGKTYMVKQIGDILNTDMTDIGYINEEYDILGYVTAMGEYSESNFYRLYKYGGIAFCDELDNGNSKATVKLNSFLSNQLRAGYCFPGGEYVEKHPDFRIVAAGNTDGSGADLNYNTRERIEESVQQRMIPIYISYDNRVEQAILKDYPDWFEFSCAFRAATDRWGDVSNIPAQGIFTTRDAYRIKQYLDNGSFTPEKIMNYEFVQTKDMEYLAFLKDEISKRLKKDSAAYGIWNLFASETDRIRKCGKRS